MPLHHHRHIRKPGLPELAVVIGLTSAAVFGGLWYGSLGAENWRRTTGWIARVHIRNIHYNATEDAARIRLTYRYEVGGIPYVQEWDGLWPIVDSPNALPPDRIRELEVADYPLVILYDPANPSRSALHQVSQGDRKLYQNLAVASFLFTFLYLGTIYPRWKRAQSSTQRPFSWDEA